MWDWDSFSRIGLKRFSENRKMNLSIREEPCPLISRALRKYIGTAIFNDYISWRLALDELASKGNQQVSWISLSLNLDGSLLDVDATNLNESIRSYEIFNEKNDCCCWLLDVNLKNIGHVRNSLGNIQYRVSQFPRLL